MAICPGLAGCPLHCLPYLEHSYRPKLFVPHMALWAVSHPHPKGFWSERFERLDSVAVTQPTTSKHCGNMPTVEIIPGWCTIIYSLTSNCKLWIILMWRMNLFCFVKTFTSKSLTVVVTANDPIFSWDKDILDTASQNQNHWELGQASVDLTQPRTEQLAEC